MCVFLHIRRAIDALVHHAVTPPVIINLSRQQSASTIITTDHQAPTSHQPGWHLFSNDNHHAEPMTPQPHRLYPRPGMHGLSALYGRPDKTEAIATLNLALNQGITFFDTAESYGNGHNETLLGEHLSHHDDIITPKFGITTNPLSFPTGQDGQPENCLAAVIGSLTRLRRDYIDLYYLHRPDPQVPIEESIGVMADLVHEGLIRHIGVSELTAELRRAADETYRILEVGDDDELRPLVLANGAAGEVVERFGEISAE